jgi:hypothetical protein
MLSVAEGGGRHPSGVAVGKRQASRGFSGDPPVRGRQLEQTCPPYLQCEIQQWRQMSQQHTLFMDRPRHFYQARHPIGTTIANYLVALRTNDQHHYYQPHKSKRARFIFRPAYLKYLSRSILHADYSKRSIQSGTALT